MRGEGSFLPFGEHRGLVLLPSDSFRSEREQRHVGDLPLVEDKEASEAVFEAVGVGGEFLLEPLEVRQGQRTDRAAQGGPFGRVDTAG